MPASSAEMRWDTQEPCASCPYRVDVPAGTWDRSEFENLLRHDANQFGAIFGCHATRKAKEGPAVCGGWLFDQVRRGVPCLSLRMIAMRKPECAAAIDAVSDGGHKLYESIADMCDANGVD